MKQLLTTIDDALVTTTDPIQPTPTVPIATVPPDYSMPGQIVAMREEQQLLKRSDWRTKKK